MLEDRNQSLGCCGQVSLCTCAYWGKGIQTKISTALRLRGRQVVLIQAGLSCIRRNTSWQLSFWVSTYSAVWKKYRRCKDIIVREFKSEIAQSSTSKAVQENLTVDIHSLTSCPLCISSVSVNNFLSRNLGILLCYLLFNVEFMNHWREWVCCCIRRTWLNIKQEDGTVQQVCHGEISALHSQFHWICD